MNGHLYRFYAYNCYRLIHLTINIEIPIMMRIARQSCYTVDTVEK